MDLEGTNPSVLLWNQEYACKYNYSAGWIQENEEQKKEFEEITFDQRLMERH